MNLENRKRLARIVDILQENGEENPIANIEQVCHLIFLKIIDEEESNREVKASNTVQRKRWTSDLIFAGQCRRYRWSEWRNRSGRELLDFVRYDVFPYMASLVSEEPQVANYFKDAQLKIDDPNILKRLVDEIDPIAFTNLEVDVKSEIIEFLLARFAQSEKLGFYRTPPHIRKLMVELIDPDFGNTIYDPACGTGGFLIESVQYILAKYSTRQREVPIYGQEWLEERGQSIEEAKEEFPNLQSYRRGIGDKITNWDSLENSIFGADISRSMMRIAKINLMLHDIRRANIKRADSIMEMEGSEEENDTRKYKVILSNPPFGGLVRIRDSIGGSVLPKSKRVELRFLEGMMDSLAPGGQCAIIVPESLLYRSTLVHNNLRRKLIEDCDVLAVISLPSGVLELHDAVKTSVLVFQLPLKITNITDKIEQRKKVWFYDLRADGFNPKKITTGSSHLTPDKNDIPDLLVQWNRYKKSGFKDPTGIEGETLLTDEKSELRCWWATVKTIKENDYNLAAHRYKPQFFEKYSDDDAIELIRETLAIERDIAIGLENLLRKVRDDQLAWDTKRIEQVCLLTGRRDTKARLDEKFLYVDASSIDSSQKVVFSNTEIVGSEQQHRVLNEIREGDILVSTVRPHLDVVAMVPPELDGQAASAELCVLRPNVDLVEKKYLFYFVTSQQFVSLLASKVRGESIPNVSDKDIKEINLPLPDLSEQRRIVKILDEANELRINSAKAGKRYFRILLALFHEFFGDPATNPKCWPTMSLEDVTIESPEYGVRANATSWTDGMPRYVRNSDISVEGCLQNSEIVSLDIDNWDSFQLTPGDILFATSGPVGRTYMYRSQDGLCVFARHLIRIKVNHERVLPWYLFALTKTDYFKRSIAMRTTPSNSPHINVKELSKVQLPIPPMSRQKDFVKMIENLSEVYDKQRTTKQNIQRIYGIILRFAFSGRLTENWCESRKEELVKDDKLAS